MTDNIRTIVVAAAILGAASILAAEPSTAQERFVPVATAEDCPADRSPILILGSYHMANPGLDGIPFDADDPLSDRRQVENEALVRRLADFRPAKVMIEAPYASSDQQDRYRAYVAGEYRLGRSEIDQIAFRLAALAGLGTVHPIDFPMMMSGLTYDELEWPAPAPLEDSAEDTTAPPDPTEEEQRLRQSTVSEYLLFLNNHERWLPDHLAYMAMFEPDRETPAIYERADRLTNWYKRNFRMWANVVRKTERPADRVFLLVGSGHLAILRTLAQDMPGFCLVEPQEYLQDRG